MSYKQVCEEEYRQFISKIDQTKKFLRVEEFSDQITYIIFLRTITEIIAWRVEYLKNNSKISEEYYIKKEKINEEK